MQAAAQWSGSVGAAQAALDTAGPIGFWPGWPTLRTVRGPAFSGLANLRLSYAVAFISRQSSMASCGVLYPIAE
jgi:hypothetical protein